MKEPLERLRESVDHLISVDDFFSTHDPEYVEEKRMLEGLGAPYEQFSYTLYEGTHKGRQMILADIIEYILTSRGLFFAEPKENRRPYFKTVLYFVNLLLLQEHVTAFHEQRKEFMEFMSSKNMPHFIEDDDLRPLYQQCIDFAEIGEDGKEIKLAPKGDTRTLYRVIDSLLPKSLGTVIELITYIYLIRKDFGFVIPLLLQQATLSYDDYLAPPDFILIHDGRVFGLEVGGALGTYNVTLGKLSQGNKFMEESSIPVLTVGVKNIYRCRECDKWILYCPEVIERFSGDSFPIDTQVECLTCPRFNGGACAFSTYYGRTQRGGDVFRYHLKCVLEKYPYVKELLEHENDGANGDSDGHTARSETGSHFVAYFPHVEGLEAFE